MRRFRAQAGRPLSGEATVPGDKSISHRAIMFGALAEGDIRVTGFLEGADCLATMAAFRQMGVDIEHDAGAGRLLVRGVGLHGLQRPESALDVGNSGTSMRLLSGLLAGQAFDSELTGDDSLRRRPMARVVGPLRSMGANIDTAEGGRAPLHIRGRAALRGIDYVMPVASAQVKSCLLLAGLYAEESVSLTEPGPSRDHSERMFEAFGVAVTREKARLRLAPGQSLRACDVEVPADLSSAAFLLVAASIVPGSELLLRNVGVNPTRDGVLTILKQMGADITRENERLAGGEPVADLRVRHAPLRGIDIDPALVPLAIDEFPALFVAAACAQGVTRLRGAAELRVKESDRIAVMADGLQALGVQVSVREDGADIHGGPLGGGRVDSHGDHRVAMAFAVAGQVSRSAIEILDCDNVDTSFPGFVALGRSVGLSINEFSDTEAPQ
ncbi:MAG: 3-phosphoshikimate 1-carboxyvinyltransferase [Salinisphaeraceae bacterium]|nr:3-phosphoshikimate 1-carboxyvinyltransferase [Salinisphaeraceae bacterium]